MRFLTATPQKVLVCAAVAWAVVLFVVLRSSYWTFDDWVYFRIALRDGYFSEQWLTSIYFQHLAPGYRVTMSLVAQMMPISFGWALAAMLAVLVGAVLMLERCLAVLFGARWVHLAAAVLLLVSYTHAPSLVWFSAALQGMPTLLLELTCLFGFLAHRATGRGRWYALSLASLALGLTLYIRPLLMPVYLALVQVAFLSPSLRPRAVWMGFWERRTVWLGYLLVCGIYAAYYYGRTQFDPPQAGDPVTLTQITQYLRIAWLRNFAPSLLGIRIDREATGWQDAAVVLAQLLVLTLVVWSVVRRRDALRAWAFFAIAAVVSLGVTTGRIRTFGPGVGYDTRYVVELTWLFPLAVCGAFAPHRAEAASATVVAARREPLPRLAWALPVAAALAVVAALGLRTTRDIERAWPGAAARGYADKLRSGVSELPPGTVLADRDVPDENLSTFTLDGQLRNVAPFLIPEQAIDGPYRSLNAVRDDGTPLPAAFRTAFGGSIGRTLASGALVVEGAASRTRRPGALCVTAGPAAAARLTMRATRPPATGRTYVSVVAAPGSTVAGVPLLVDQGNGVAPATPEPVVLRADTPSLRWTQAATTVAVALDVAASQRLCLRSFSVGAVSIDP